MISERDIVHISKFLSLVLRHQPDVVGLSLEAGGWMNVDDLIRGAGQAGVQLDRALLQAVVEQSERKRFSISEDGQRIRANYGHSIPLELDKAPLEPPVHLFYGTAIRFLEAIRDNGILPRGRQYVHLSAGEQAATEIGRRHGVPVVLIVQARSMHLDDYKFYLTDSGIWLTEKVPVAYLIFPESRTPEE